MDLIADCRGTLILLRGYGAVEVLDELLNKKLAVKRNASAFWSLAGVMGRPVLGALDELGERFFQCVEALWTAQCAAFAKFRKRKTTLRTPLLFGSGT